MTRILNVIIRPPYFINLRLCGMKKTLHTQKDKHRDCRREVGMWHSVTVALWPPLTTLPPECSHRFIYKKRFTYRRFIRT